MNKATREALEIRALELGFRLANEVIVPWLVRLIAEGIDAPAALSSAAHIVRGIEDAHPDWSAEQKREYARDAIARLLENRNGRRPAERDINAALELAVLELAKAAR